MIKKFNYNEGINFKTKIFIFLFLLLSFIYLIDKFFDNFTFVSPVKRLEFQFFIQKRDPQKFLLKTQTEMPLKQTIPPSPVSIITPPSKTLHLGAKETQRKVYQTISNSSLEDYTPPNEAIKIFFGDDRVAFAIAQAESGLNCKKTSDTQDYGLFQINQIHLWRFKKFNGNPLSCFDNAKVAYEIWKEQGWNAWSVFRNKSYLKFL